MPAVLDRLRDSFPGHFALVMATGIVSLAMAEHGAPGIARALFAVNVVAYVVLWIAGGARTATTPRAVFAGLADHVRGASYLTIVAGSSVLGVQCAKIGGAEGVALALWVLSVILWVALVYAFFAAMTVAEPKPRLEDGIDGSWLLATVSTESLAVLGTLVAPQFARPDVVVFACLVLFLAGAMLYILVIGLIFFRWLFRPMGRDTLTPTYWINMGAVAITTLAGAHLIDVAGDYPFVAGLQHFITGFTLFFWATGTWWIPLLVVLFAWRHFHQRVPIRYDAQYWSLVFPLGMYSVATRAYARDNDLAFLYSIAGIAADVALVAWTLTAIGLAHRVLGRRPRTS